MQVVAPKTRSSNEAFAFDWEQTLDQLIAETEAAELRLASEGGDRKQSGSFYTPADVASHFWDLFLRHHSVADAVGLRTLIERTDFVEPSAGSGIFIFSFIRKALGLGLSPLEVAEIRFHVIDINFGALGFFKAKIDELSAAIGVKFDNVGCDQIDFLEWAARAQIQNVAFVGNPPFVANARGSKWRNLYADFLEAMLNFRSDEKAISLILPMSVCFSRDYAALRSMIQVAGLGISASSYDNIPDCLFKSGKPESTNTNRANSQRCTILNLGGSDPGRREAAPLHRWATRDRIKVLGGMPAFRAYNDRDFRGQFPRPDSERVMAYLAEAGQAPKLGSMLVRNARSAFAVGAVARNFIGIREPIDIASGAVRIRTASEDDMLIVLQILASGLFFEYWRTLGDGFHVTNEMIEQFPIAPGLFRTCERNLVNARQVWANRGMYAKEKLNSGKIVRSYDFTGAFGHSLL